MLLVAPLDFLSYTSSFCSLYMILIARKRYKWYCLCKSTIFEVNRMLERSMEKTREHQEERE